MNHFLKTFHKYHKMINNSDTTSLSYYMILSVIPILTLLITSLRFFNFDVEIVKKFLLRYFTSDTTMFLIDFLTQRSASYLSIVAIGMCLMVSSRGFFRMKQVINRLYEISSETFNFFKNRLYSIFNTMTFILISAILIIAFGLLPSLTFLIDWLHLAGLSKLILTFVILFILMLLINLIVPSVWPGLKAGCLGALVSAFGMTGVSVFIQLFRNAATYDTIYGPLASLAAILIMLNWMSHIIYFGICFSSVIYLENQAKEVDYER